MSSVEQIDREIETLKQKREEVLKEQVAKAALENILKLLGTPFVQEVGAVFKENMIAKSEVMRLDLHKQVDEQTEESWDSYLSRVRKMLHSKEVYIKVSELEDYIGKAIEKPTEGDDKEITEKKPRVGIV